jgi:SAM-dependent methyltransferase
MVLLGDPVELWNRRYVAAAREARVNYEAWLDRWAGLIRSRRGRALDLGCGPGFDTEFLLAQKFEVAAVDFSVSAILLSKQRNPAAEHSVADIRHLLVVTCGKFDVVVGNLSLHYFDYRDSCAIFDSIKALLRPNGVFLFRVNAFDEEGAPADRSSWALSTVDGIAKQYFDSDKIITLLGEELSLLSIEKRTTQRFGRLKSLYEVVAVKSPHSDS